MISTEYVAGFFDGEGTVGIYLQKSKYAVLTVGISNTNKHILELIKVKYGGNIYERKIADKGRKRVFQWKLGTIASMFAFLLDIASYVVVKKDAVDLALEYIEKYCSGPIKQDVSGRMEFYLLTKT